MFSSKLKTKAANKILSTLGTKGNVWQEIYEPGGVGKIWGFDNRLSLATHLPVLQVSGPSEVSDKDDEEWL